ncbi:MobA/MobL family protein [Flintibacter porci]|uniref:MobA/MobL family protein n=1 Tax=Flintibacter porci TaxID=3342383 RepID=UPI003F8AC441
MKSADSKQKHSSSRKTSGCAFLFCPIMDSRSVRKTGVQKRTQEGFSVWNAVEEVETAKDSRLAREFVVALPIELSRQEQIELLHEFIREQFVSDGMCADAAIHDTDGHNPHAHILLTVRPLDEQGKWQYKTEKEYLCMKNGEERGFTAAEFKAAQNEGWEKQYPYKVGKKKVYMTPSAAEAQGLVRADKHPKSTRYGRQNSISERWNSEEPLAAWRAAWADVSNRYLERAGREERIDHRSNAARGIDEIPTIHEGVTAQALERKGIISDRCEINRQIREQNKLIRAIRDEITKLKNTIMTSVPALAKALETARKGILLLRYSWLYHTGAAKTLDARIQEIQPSYERFLEVRRFLREKSRQKKALTAELKALSPTSFLRRGDIKRELAAVTEDMGELKSELSMLLADFGKTDAEGMKDVKQQLDAMTASKTGLETIAAKAADSMDTEIEKFRALQEQAKTVNTAELHTARMELRGEMTAAVREKIKDTFGKSYDYDRFRQADRDVSELLGEPHPDEQRSVLHKLHRTQEQPAAEKQNRSHKNEQEL